MSYIPSVFVCPKCKGKLEDISADLVKCSACQADFQVKDNIPIFAPLMIDEFYENRLWVTEQELSDKAPAWEKFKVWFYLNFSLGQRRQRFIKRMLKGKKGLVLDLGCGGGKQFYRQVGPVIGIDICLNGLKLARRVYHAVAQADVLELPFADNLFDFVVSNDLIEHIPSPQKEQMFKEMWRVLKPGGRLVHEVETLSGNLWYRLGLRDMNLFFKYFVVEISGHFGLEPSGELLARFKKLGARQVKVENLFDLFWPLNDFLRLFGQGYRDKYPSINLLTGWGRIINERPLLRTIAEVKLELAARITGPFRKIDHAKDLGVCFEKPAN